MTKITESIIELLENEEYGGVKIELDQEEAAI